MTEFRIGQKVRVEAFEGRVTHVSPYNVDVSSDRFDRDVEYIPLDLVTPLVENWPPQVGDVWAVGELEWFTRRSYSDPNVLILVPDHAERALYDSSVDGFEKFKALGPQLVRRK